MKGLARVVGTVAGIGLLTIIAFGVYRGTDFISCKIAASDLKRDTEFSWVSGKCVVVNKDGSRVYLNQIRGYGDGE